jgi:hypothetical protein
MLNNNVSGVFNPSAKPASDALMSAISHTYSGGNMATFYYPVSLPLGVPNMHVIKTVDSGM